MQNGPNVDPAEIAKFDAAAPRWWDPDGEFRPLHDLNPARLDYVEARAGLAGQQVLDVGCGGGLLAEGMARRGARVTWDRPRAGGARGRTTARPRGRSSGGIPASRGRSARRIGARGIRPRHLPRDAGARARPGGHRRGARPPRAARRARHRLDDQPQRQGLRPRHRRRRIRDAAPADGHASLRAPHPAVGTVALGA